MMPERTPSTESRLIDPLMRESSSAFNEMTAALIALSSL